MLTLATATAKSSAGAQASATVRGTVTRADSTTPARGVIVALVNTTGDEVGRAITDAGGRFAIRAPAGRFSLRALQIGYLPTTSKPFDAAQGETREMHVVLDGAAVHLDEVRIEGESTCRIREDSARAVATLWEQARGVLAASTLATSDEPYHSVLVRYRNIVPAGVRRVIDETVSVVETSGPTGFVSLGADSLATQGFIVTAGRRAEFRAPDAAVLLSPEFAAAHCFRLVPASRGRASWLGVAFWPSAERRGFSDIQGSLWLDRATSELREIDYTYLNVPSTMRRDDAAGSVAFARLPTGDWIVSRWAIRTPITDPGSRRMPGMPDTLLGVRTAGGITRSVLRDTTVLYENYMGAVKFTLVASDGVNVTAGSDAAIDATDRIGRADSTGSITFTNIPAGRYRARFWTPLMRWFDVSPEEVEFAVTDTTDDVRTVEMPTADDIAHRACSRATLVYGYVVGDKGQGVGSAYARLSGRTYTGFGGGGPTSYDRLVRSDAAGRWRTCVPPGTVEIAAQVGDTVGLIRTVSLMSGTRLLRLDLVTPDPPGP